MTPNPRVDPACENCVAGEYEYQEQVTTARGELRTLFACGDCGDEVRVE